MAVDFTRQTKIWAFVGVLLAGAIFICAIANFILTHFCDKISTAAKSVDMIGFFICAYPVHVIFAIIINLQHGALVCGQNYTDVAAATKVPYNPFAYHVMHWFALGWGCFCAFCCSCTCCIFGVGYATGNLKAHANVRQPDGSIRRYEYDAS